MKFTISILKAKFREIKLQLSAGANKFIFLYDHPILTGNFLLQNFHTVYIFCIKTFF